MASKNTISEIMDQTRKIEENNNTNSKYTSDISSLINSNNISQIVDKELQDKLNKLNKQVKDINTLTSELLSDLSKRHN